MISTVPDPTDNYAATCCGQRPPGSAGNPLVPACQLCPNSATYWRNTAPSQTASATPQRATPLPDYGHVLDWSRNKTGDPKPCRLCGKPAMMRDPDGRPCHKVCAEQEPVRGK